MTGRRPINREKTTPLLLRVFVKENRAYTCDDFADADKLPRHVQVYTWKDATLKELSQIVQSANAKAREPNARFRFSLVYPLPTGDTRVKVEEVGQVHSSRESADDALDLRDIKFETGDFVGVEVCSS